MNGLRAWLERAVDRPTWRRTLLLSEEILSDLFTTLLLMIAIFISHACAKFLGIDQLPIASGYAIGHIFTYLHAANLIANGACAL